MADDEAFFDRALRRIERNTLYLGGAGALAALIGWGWTSAAGFAAGAAASYLNYRWLKQMVEGFSGGARPRKRRALLFGFRYLLFGAALYAIVRFFAVNLAAALCGFLTAVAAVILEILYELIHART
jgi:hypothetical protein